VFRLMRLLGLHKNKGAWSRSQDDEASAKDTDDLESGAVLLVITRDSDLYAEIREIVAAWKWTICRQPEFLVRPDYGPPIARRCSIVIYDADSTNGNWKEVFVKLKATDGDPCILLASRVFDPYLRNEVIRCGGFDVIAKSAGSEQLMRTLRFAWFWKRKSQGRSSGAFHHLIAVAIVGTTLLGMGLSSCNRTQAAARTTPEPQAPTVSTAPVTLREMADHLTVSSELVPFQEIDVYAKEAGYVKELYVDYGTHVHKGQVMAVLEIPELEAQLQQDQAAIKARIDEVTRARNQVSQAKAQHDVQHLQYNRIASVAKAKPGLVAQQEVDDWQAKDLASESNLEAVQGNLDTAQSEVAVAQAKLTHDQALYDYAKVTAPFDGVVTQRYANYGALMQAGTSTTQSTPLVRLSQENIYRLVIPVPESYVPYIKIGDQVDVKVSALNKDFTGKVVRFSYDVTNDTRTMHTEVDINNTNNGLMPGLYAEAILTLNQKPNAITVPVQAIDHSGDNTSVMVLRDGGIVESRPVTLGLQTPNYAQVVSGLTVGEQVVVSDRSGLKPGEHVLSHPAGVLAYDSSGGH
jgi:RND family efflux transporter MFP subunit